MPGGRPHTIDPPAVVEADPAFEALWVAPGCAFAVRHLEAWRSEPSRDLGFSLPQLDAVDALAEQDLGLCCRRCDQHAACHEQAEDERTGSGLTDAAIPAA